MLHLETLAPSTLTLLESLLALPALAEMRLVGGTALALQLGHRTSVDLDFCGTRICGSPDDLRSELARLGEPTVEAESPSVHVYTLRGVKLDVVSSAYPWLDDAVVPGGLRLASPRDIAAMKLLAITNRGARKDFIDLAVLLERFALADMIDAYRRKYAGHSLFALYKSLVYFEDAEEEPMPAMLCSIGWQEAKARVEDAVRRELESRRAPSP